MSHEAIYQWVYAQPVAMLRRELVALRSERTARRGPRPAPAPRINEPRYLDERPAEAPGPRGAWALGRGSGDREGGQDRRGHTRGADQPIPHPGSPDRAGLAECHRGDHRRRRATARLAETLADLELRLGDGATRRGHRYRVDIPSDPRYMAAIAAEINDRPRKLHNWKKPSEVFTELLESDAYTV